MLRGDRGQELRAGDVQDGIVAANVNACVSYVKRMIRYGMRENTGRNTVYFFSCNFIFIIYAINVYGAYSYSLREQSACFDGSVFYFVGAGCVYCDSLKKTE